MLRVFINLAYIDIIRVPEKLAENKYEGYYLVTTAEESYIVGMQPEQFADLKQRVEENGTARVEGMTKVVTDEKMKQELWQDWFIDHFPGGPTDPGYVLLKFESNHATYWIEGTFIHKKLD